MLRLELCIGGQVVLQIETDPNINQIINMSAESSYSLQ